MTLAHQVWAGFRSRTVGWWYRYLGELLAGSPIVCLNYGYAFTANVPQPKLSSEQEGMRPYLQLYHRVAELAGVRGKDLLEVSCGYGGGASYLRSAHHPRTIIGLDASPTAIGRASSRFGAPGLTFLVGQAGALGLPSLTFDVALSIEASHCYPDMAAFLSEAHRVLRPGGCLALADYRPAPEILRLTDGISAAGFVIQDSIDITQNVIRSLEVTHEQRREWIMRYGPSWLRPMLDQLAGTRGSIVHKGFVSGRLNYRMFRALKP